MDKRGPIVQVFLYTAPGGFFVLDPDNAPAWILWSCSRRLLDTTTCREVLDNSHVSGTRTNAAEAVGNGAETVGIFAGLEGSGVSESHSVQHPGLNLDGGLGDDAVLVQNLLTPGLLNGGIIGCSVFKSEEEEL